jgi:hypothetical protein
MSRLLAAHYGIWLGRMFPWVHAADSPRWDRPPEDRLIDDEKVTPLRHAARG